MEDLNDGFAVSVVVLTALPLEYRAVRKHLIDLRRVEHAMGTGFEVGHLPGVAAGIALGRTGEGNAPAAVLAARAIEAFRPHAVLFVGIAGALKDDVALGDVVVATRVYAVHGAKEQDGRSLARPNAFNAAHELLDLAQHLDTVSDRWADGADGWRTGFRLHFKPIAAGEVVLDSRDTALARQLHEHYNDAAAVEMESAGVAQAAHLSRAVSTLIVRGISDRADGRKHLADIDGAQPVAAANAAAFAMALVRERLLTIPAQPITTPPETPPPRAPGLIYSTLPLDTAAFTGRNAQIDRITEHTMTAISGGVVAINAINGMPGIGKTTLAVHIAHQLAQHFPDRQLFVDLQGHVEGRPPADSAGVLAGLLVADGLDPHRMPSGLNELSGLWRSRLAARRVLLVLDNAASSAQVAPLLPGSSSCLVLITSRRHLGDLPGTVAQITLDVLPLPDAIDMFRRLVPRAAKDESVAELVELAGCLPLAISLLAAVYTKHEAWTMSDLIHETRASMLTMTAESRTVAAAFALSYRTLSAPRKRLFRLLGLHPGTDFDVYAAAALTGRSPQWAAAQLDALHSDRLLTEPTYQRYSMHDLIRAYANSLAMATESADKRDDAVAKLFSYYQHTAISADTRTFQYARHEPRGQAPAHGPVFDNPNAARRWLRGERANLEACLELAAGQGWHERVVALSEGLAELLYADGPWFQARTVHTASALAAQYVGDHRGEANALHNLGRVLHMTGNYPDAIDAHTRACEIFGQLSDLPGQADCFDELGRLLHSTGRLASAIDAHTNALTLYEELEDRVGQATALDHRGMMRRITEDFTGATQDVTRALALHEEVGDRLGQAKSHALLGWVRQSTGDSEGARDARARAQDLYQELGERPAEASGQPYGPGARIDQAGALIGLARMRILSEDYSGAIEAQVRALEIYRDVKSGDNEAWATNIYAAIFVAAGDIPRALTTYHDALRLTREVQHRDDEAIALEGIGECTVRTGNTDEGIRYLNLALDLFRHLDMRPDATRVEARLRTL